jgi:hypothetical protein
MSETSEASTNNSHTKIECSCCDCLRNIWRGIVRVLRWPFLDAQRVIALGTLVLATGTIALAGISFQQTQVLRAEQRAWLAPGHIIAPDDFKMSDNPPPGSTEIFIAFENSGKEPALHTTELIDVTVVEGPPSAKNKSIIDAFINKTLNGKACKDVYLNQEGRAIFPGAHPRIGNNLTVEQRRDALTGGHYALAAGCLAYETQGQPHWSEVCEFLDPIPKTPWPSDWRTAICPFHTQAN